VQERLGIALLGLGHDPEDRTMLLTLARHNDFTSFALDTLLRTLPDPTPANRGAVP
jgi:hypothetical protein